MADVKMYNKGRRTWNFGNGLPDFPSGAKMDVPEKIAKKYAESYPNDFEIMGDVKTGDVKTMKKSGKKKEEQVETNQEKSNEDD